MNDLTVIAIGTTGAAGMVSGVIAALTMAWPTRPRWVPVLLAVLLGFLAQAAILFRIDNLVTPNLWIDAFLLGIPAGLSAIGINAANRSGDAARAQVEDSQQRAAAVDDRPQGPQVNL